MDMILTSGTMTGTELERFGLVSRCFEGEMLLQGTMECAKVIAGMSMPVVGLAKEAVLAGWYHFNYFLICLSQLRDFLLWVDVGVEGSVWR